MRIVTDISVFFFYNMNKYYMFLGPVGGNNAKTSVLPHRHSLDRSNTLREREGYYSDRNELIRERERERDRGYLSDREQRDRGSYFSDHNISSLVFEIIFYFRIMFYIRMSYNFNSIFDSNIFLKH